MYRYLASAFAVIFVSPAMAQTVAQTEADEMEESSEVIIVTAARTQLPASALPLTVDVIDSESLQRQVQISGSTVDAVSALLPSFSPTREKLSGAGKACVAVRRFTPSTASPNRHRCETVRVMDIRLTRFSSTGWK